jgi:hypothetical protein
VEMLERDVYTSSTEPKRTPAATPVEPTIPELPSTPFEDAFSPMVSARSKASGLRDSDLDEWAGLLDNGSPTGNWRDPPAL